MTISSITNFFKSSLPRFFPLGIVLLGMAIYANTFNVPFVFDDGIYIVDNRPVRDFRYFVDSDLANGAISQEDVNTNFLTRKFTFFTFALNYRLHGLTVRGYHVVNILIHLINGLLVYQLVLATLRTPLFREGMEEEPTRQTGSLAALLTALFFIAHPVQTEAVTYLCQRFTSLATLFYLLALLLYIRWRASAVEHNALPGRSRPALYCLALTATFLAMFSKEISFTLPLVLIGYEWLFFGRPGRKNLLALLPFAATLLIIPVIIFREGEQYEDVSRLMTSLSGDRPENPAVTYLLTQFRVIVTYLRLLVLPIQQNLDYDYPRYTSFFQVPVAISFLLLCLIAGAGAFLYFRSLRLPPVSARWYRLTAFGIFWFFTALAVESTVMPLKDLIFEHRIYLPSVGFFLAMLGLVGMTHERLGKTGSRVLTLFLIAVLVALSAAAHSRNTLWREPIALWEDTVNKSPGKARAHHNLGQEYVARGRYDQAIKQLETAILLAVDAEDTWRSASALGELYLELGKYEQLRREYPGWVTKLLNAPDRREDDPKYYNSLGIFYAKVQQWQEAEAAYRKAIALKSDMAVYHLNLAWIYLNQKKPDLALPPLRTAERLDPDYELVQECLGDVYVMQGKQQEALQVYLRAQHLDPGSPTIYRKIYDLSSLVGNLEEAGRVLEQGARVRGDDPLLHTILGNYYELMNRPTEAEKAYLRAVRLGRDNGAPLKKLGDFYLRQGRFDQAVEYLEQAAALDPLNHNIYYNLGHSYAAQGEYDAATRAYEQVLSLAPADAAARQQLEQVRQLKNEHPLSR